MIDVNVITLEDNLDYMIINTIERNSNKYLVLAKVDNEKDICVRKVIVENNTEYLVKLDSNEELSDVLKEFNSKYNMEMKDNEK